MEDIFSIKNNFQKYSEIPVHLLVGNYEDCTNPLVTVIMPCYKRVDFFKEALLSAINQDCDFDYEIIVLDNNADVKRSPVQDIVEELNAPNVYYYRNEKNIGMTSNWNRGIELARSEYVTYCHDDDVLLPNCLSRLMELQKKHGNKCILSEYNYIDDNNQYLNPPKYPLVLKKHGIQVQKKDSFLGSLYYLFYDNLWCGGGCLFNRKCMLEIGGYNDDFYPTADYALNIVYTYHYGAIINAIPTYNYRIGASNESNNAWVNSVRLMDFCRGCMMSKIHLPKWYLEKLRNALNKKFTIQYNSKFAPDEHSEGYSLTKIESRLIKFGFFYVQRIKPYKFRLSKS